MSVTLLKRFVQPVTIADTDSLRLQCVQRADGDGKEGGNEGKKHADTPESLKCEVKTSFRPYVNAGRDGGMNERWWGKRKEKTYRKK